MELNERMSMQLKVDASVGKNQNRGSVAAVRAGSLVLQRSCMRGKPVPGHWKF